MNNNQVAHRSVVISPKVAECDVYAPVNQLANLEGEKLVIVPGLGSVKTDYEKFGRALAAHGFVVISPDCNNGGNGNALGNRRDVILNTMDTLKEPVRLLPHSLGAPVTAMAMQDANIDNVTSINFMQPAAFTDHGIGDSIGLAKFYFGEFLPQAHRLLPDMMKHRKHHRQRMDISKRIAETWGLFKLDADFMVDAVKDLHDKKVAMSFMLGPKDYLTPADVIRSAVQPIVGSDRIMDVHPEAGHLAAQTHPKRMARLMIQQFNMDKQASNHDSGLAA